jgi:hypothetical protein
MARPQAVCLPIKWREVAALSLRYYCSLREGQKHAYTGVLRLICGRFCKKYSKNKKFAIFLKNNREKVW